MIKIILTRPLPNSVDFASPPSSKIEPCNDMVIKTHSILQQRFVVKLRLVPTKMLSRFTVSCHLNEFGLIGRFPQPTR